ncbi:MAG TPA: hypothetical protein VGM72_01860, partial [Micropepsaceae bacterium]
MKCSPRPPLVVTRSGEAIATALAENRRGYTPEWRTPRGMGEAGAALNDILARYLQIQGDGLNAMPRRLQLELLESLGVNVLPPQAARAPLVFKLVETASGDATVPMGTRVAAVLPPPSPSLESDAAPKSKSPPEFFTEQEFTAMRGQLGVLYSIDPQADTFVDHTPTASSGFDVFSRMSPVPHRLYLGHGELFKLTGSAQIVLSFDFAASSGGGGSGSQRPLLLDWEYLSVDGWQPLELTEDRTERFTVDGKVTLEKVYGPDSQEDLVGGTKSCWIRATVSNRTPGARISSEAAGYLIRYTPVAPPFSLEPGDRVGITGDPLLVNVLDVGNAILIVDAPLSAAVRGAPLQRADGTAIGSVLGAPAEFRLPVESTRDLLAGDVVTVDGAQSASVVTLDGDAVYLSVPLAAAQPGMIIELADALPPLRPDGADDAGVLPQVDLIRARVGFGKTDLPADSAYLDSTSVDISKDFYPFGTEPARFATFYVACKEAFERNGARIELNFTYAQPGRDDGGPKVAAEFFDGSRWIELTINNDYSDGSLSLTRPFETDPAFPHAKLSFTVPANWEASEVNGDKQRWLRLRLSKGDYGHPLALSVEPDPDDNTKYIVKSTPSTLQPPIIARLAVNYLYFTNPQSPDYCLTENDFAFAEHSEDARWPRSPFEPFTPVSDRTPALHFGFTSKPPAALVSLLVQVLAPAIDGDPQPFAWDYWGSRGWTELSVRDATLGLRQTGLLQFVGAPDALPREGMNGALYQIRARLKTGLASQDQIVQCGGVWLNAAWARQGQSVDRDQLGISNGNPEQTFALPIVRAAKSETVAAP